jgi:hypothetical protein
MSKRSAQALRALGGRCVDVTLRNGRRIDGCQLVSGGRAAVTTLWLLVDGEDVFVAERDVIGVIAGDHAGAGAATV